MDVNSVLKKYTTCKIKEYDKLQEVLKEARRCVCTFDKLMNDDKAVSMFSYSSDRLYKLIVNQASSYVNKLKHYEEGVNKKAARISKVA
jgi:5-bromo-4-chloroindolyl phosphate hydrolysis protein